MRFKPTGNVLLNHTGVKAEQVGFFKVDRPYNEVVFKTADGVYFNAYGSVLQEVA